MKLAQYLAEAGISYGDFADRINVSNGKVVHRYAKGERIPEPAVMARIVDATDGRVQPNDFYDVSSVPASPAGEDALVLRRAQDEGCP